jgi:hypothetical protein
MVFIKPQFTQKMFSGFLEVIAIGNVDSRQQEWHPEKKCRYYDSVTE